MASLLVIQGPTAGSSYPLASEDALIGRQPDAAIFLEALAVSRQHARLSHHDGAFFIEDLGSSNGTYVNGSPIRGPTPLASQDTLQIGPYVLQLQMEPSLPEVPAPAHEPIIRAQIAVTSAGSNLYSQNPAYKLQVILEIAQHLGRTLETDELLGKLLEHLLRLFVQADRGMVVLCERERLIVRSQRTRKRGKTADFPYSRTLVRRALDDGVGLLSEDVGGDRKLKITDTLASLKLRSFLCVPLLGSGGRRLGVIQLDCLRDGHAFRSEDLEVLTAVALHVAVVLENAELHAERLRQERLQQELRMARDIQQSFLPTVLEGGRRQPGEPEIFARVYPAREVSGDLYDFFGLPDGRLAFYVGDVSGKGMPAALFMIAVRTLSRHLAPATRGPAELLERLHEALVADNPTALYVTLLAGMYDPRDGSVLLSAGAHPPPLLRHANGTVEEVALPPGLMLGSAAVGPVVHEEGLVLQPGQTLILYTDGLTDVFDRSGKNQFGREQLAAVLGGVPADLPLQSWATTACTAVQNFTGQSELQDDQTLLLLRRPP